MNYGIKTSSRYWARSHHPLGKTVDEFWESLKNGVSGAGPITRFDASNYKTHFACEVKDYNPTDYFDRKEARKLDLFAQFAEISSAQAVKDSGIDLDAIDKDRAGVIWGAGIGGLDTFYKEVTEFNKRPESPKFSPFFIPKMIANIASGNISIKYGFRGPNMTTVTACASSSHAIIDAAMYIRMEKLILFYQVVLKLLLQKQVLEASMQ